LLLRTNVAFEEVVPKAIAFTPAPPNALALLPAVNVPELIVIPPVKLLLPDRLRLPAPLIVRLRDVFPLSVPLTMLPVKEIVPPAAGLNTTPPSSVRLPLSVDVPEE